MSELGQQLIQGMREAVAIARGEMEAPRRTVFEAIEAPDGTKAYRRTVWEHGVMVSSEVIAGRPGD